MEWKDYDDFERKYGSDANPESLVVRDFIGTWYSKAGLLLRYGMIDRELLYDFLGYDSISVWNKYGEIVRTQRELYSFPEMYRDWEYLYDEMVKIASRRGIDTKRTQDVTYTDELRRKLASNPA